MPKSSSAKPAASTFGRTPTSLTDTNSTDDLPSMPTHSWASIAAEASPSDNVIPLQPNSASTLTSKTTTSNPAHQSSMKYPTSTRAYPIPHQHQYNAQELKIASISPPPHSCAGCRPDLQGRPLSPPPTPQTTPPHPQPDSTSPFRLFIDTLRIGQVVFTMAPIDPGDNFLPPRRSCAHPAIVRSINRFTKMVRIWRTTSFEARCVHSKFAHLPPGRLKDKAMKSYLLIEHGQTMGYGSLPVLRLKREGKMAKPTWVELGVCEMVHIKYLKAFSAGGSLEVRCMEEESLKALQGYATWWEVQMKKDRIERLAQERKEKKEREERERQKREEGWEYIAGKKKKKKKGATRR